MGAYWFRVVRASVCPSMDPCVTLFDACHILWTVHAKVLKFHIWILYEKCLTRICFLVRVISLSGVMLLWKKKRMNSCQQDISQSIWPRSLKLGQRIEDDAWITGLTCEQIPSIFFLAMTLWKFRHFKLVSNIWARSLNLGQLIWNNKRKTWLNFGKIPLNFCRSYDPLKMAF